MDQAKQWFQFWSAHPELHDQARKVWRAVFKRLIYMRARSRWRWATGTQGAMTFTLRDLGWAPRAPDLWAGKNGDERRHQGDIMDSYTEVFQALRPS
eukprot:5110618-Pyramimonas_sp.AAC.1